MNDKNNESLTRYWNAVIVGYRSKISLTPKLVKRKAVNKTRTFKLTEEEQYLQTVVIIKLEQLSPNPKSISPRIPAKEVNFKNYERNVSSVKIVKELQSKEGAKKAESKFIPPNTQIGNTKF